MSQEHSWDIHGCKITQKPAEPGQPHGHEYDKTTGEMIEAKPANDGWQTFVERDGVKLGPFDFTGQAIKAARKVNEDIAARNKQAVVAEQPVSQDSAPSE